MTNTHRLPKGGATIWMLAAIACVSLTGHIWGQNNAVEAIREVGQNTDGRLQTNDLQYLGAFRLPGTSDKSASRFAYGGYAMAYNPTGQGGKGSLFIAGHAHHQLVAEVSSSQPRKSRNMADLETAELLQPFADVTGGLKQSLGKRQMQLGGLLVYDKTLFWTIYKWYNVEGETLPSHGASDLTLRLPEAHGLWRVGAFHSQKTAGFLCEVPRKWQSVIGSPMLTGQSRMQGRATSSEGPAAFGFNPWEGMSFAKNDAVLRSKEFLSYDVKHPAQYGVNGAVHGWKGANEVAGMVFPESADEKASAVIFFVKLGQHSSDWYGTPDNFPGPGKVCGGGSGYHAPPYKAAAWFYDPNDLISVSSGRTASWALRPYAVKDISADLFGECAQVGAVTYDAKARRIYLVEQSADPRDPNERSPVIHVYALS